MFFGLLITLAFVFAGGCSVSGESPAAHQRLLIGGERTVSVGDPIFTCSDYVQIEYVCILGANAEQLADPPPIPVELKWIYTGLSDSMMAIAFEVNGPESAEQFGLLPPRKTYHFDLTESQEVSLKELRIHVREATEGSITFIVTHTPPISAGVSASSAQ